jgi:two-component system nitrate/nitrite response regulator NarL
MQERVTVYVADDHPLFLDGLAKAIRARPELELVGSSDDGRVALSDIVDLAPAVAVLDLRMPTLDGLRVLNALRRDGLPTAALILSAHVESTVVYEALAAGARGYLSKLTSEQAVCEAIAAVARGETVLPPEVQPALLDEIRRRGTPDRPLLTDREHEVLRLLADGSAVPRIADQLHLSPATVRTHLQNLYEKLGVSSQAAAVASAMRLGLLE